MKAYNTKSQSKHFLYHGTQLIVVGVGRREDLQMRGFKVDADVLNHYCVSRVAHKINPETLQVTTDQVQLFHCEVLDVPEDDPKPRGCYPNQLK